MKKYLLIVLTMFILLLASCNIEHKHTMSEWHYSETEHWRVPVCGHNDCLVQAEFHDYGEHIDENNDDLCDICNYSFSKETVNNNLEDIIVDLYKEKNDLKDEVKLDKIYMQFTKDNKLVVLFLIDMFADDALGSEKVNDVHFYYRDSRRIEVYYDNEIYTLQQAFDNGLLTQENLIEIAKIQNENCKLGHAWDKGYFDHRVPTGEKYFVQTCLVCGETKSELVEDVVDDLTVTDVNFHYVETGYYNIETSYKLIYSKNDLTRYYENNKDKYNLENNIYATNFLEVCDSYTSAFFEDNILILIPTTVGNTKDELFVLSYEVDGKNFIINIETVWPESEADGADVIVGCHLFVEVKEEHLEKAQYIKIIKDGVWDNEPPQERKLSKWYNFLDDVNVEDIKEVQWVDYRGSIAPGALQDTKFSNDATDISNIFNYFKNLKLELTEPNQIDQIKPGYAPKYYAFVTDDEVYYVYLHSYMNKNSAIYTVDFDVPDMEYAIAANNILDHFSNHKVYFTTKVDPGVLDEITYLGDLMIKEYDNGNKYHMSDELYIDFDGVKIRIIDETHFEYNQKYYEIIGTVDFSRIYYKMAPISARKNIYTASVYFIDTEELYLTAEIKYMDDQILEYSAITSIIKEETQDIFKTWYLYLDEECTIPFENITITSDVTIYATIKAPNNNNPSDSYGVTVTGSKDSLMEPIKSSYKAGTVVEIKAYPVTDVTLHVFVNDEQIPMSHFDSDYWGYEFVMPTYDITIHLTYDPFYGRDEYSFDELWNTKFLDNEISKVAIKTIDYSEAYSFVVTKYSYKQEDINNFKDITNQKLIKVDNIGAGLINCRHEIMFYVDSELHGEIVDSLNFEDNLYVWNDFSSWQEFRFMDETYVLPTIENPDLITYSFIYDGLSSDVKSYEDESFAKRFFNISYIEFIPYEGERINANPKFYIDSRYGIINLLDSTIFELNGVYYEIVSGTEYWAYDYFKLGN